MQKLLKVKKTGHGVLKFNQQVKKRIKQNKLRDRVYLCFVLLSEFKNILVYRVSTIDLLGPGQQEC